MSLFPIDSVRSFLKKNKMGKFNEEETAQKAEEQQRKLEEERLASESIKVGSRCEVRAVGQPNKRGTVLYVGE